MYVLDNQPTGKVEILSFLDVDTHLSPPFLSFFLVTENPSPVGAGPVCEVGTVIDNLFSFSFSFSFCIRT